MKEEKKYPFLMIEIWTDPDKTSDTYQEKYVTAATPTALGMTEL